MSLEVDSLGFDYFDNEKENCSDWLLHDISFSLMPGTLLHVRGENGSGKTTLLKLLAGVLLPGMGNIRFKGSRDICYLGHKTGISPLLTVHENARYDLQCESKTDFTPWLERFGLLSYQHTPCCLLSAGLKRRVGLLRLGLSKAPLWIIDEPLVSLDEDAIAVFMACVYRHLEQGGIVVLTSHQPLPPSVIAYGELDQAVSCDTRYDKKFCEFHLC